MSPHKKPKKSHKAQDEPHGVVEGNNCVSSPIQVLARTDGMDIGVEETQVGSGSVGEEFQAQIEISMHKKTNESQVGQDEPDGVEVGNDFNSTSTHGSTEANDMQQVVMDIAGEEMKVGAGNVEKENELQALIEISTHRETNGSHLTQVEPYGVVVSSKIISTSTQVQAEANATQQVDMDKGEEMIVGAVNFGQENELQARTEIAPHEKQNGSHIARVQPQGVPGSSCISSSDQLMAKSVVAMDKGDKVKVAVGDVVNETKLDILIRMAQHNKPKKTKVSRIQPKGNLCCFSCFIASFSCSVIYMKMIFDIDYVCTKEDIQLIECLKSAPEERVLVDIDGVWLDRKDMECMFHDDMQFNGEVSTSVYFKLLNRS